MEKNQKIKSFVVVIILSIAMGYSQANNDSLNLKFQTLLNAPWQECFVDPLTAKWERNWFLYGEEASITHSENGMVACGFMDKTIV